MDLQTVLEHKCKLGEGSVWDTDTKSILWIDIVEGIIHQFNTQTNEHRYFEVGEMVGSIVLREKGGLVAAVKNGFAFIDTDKKTLQQIINPEKIESNRFNDGKCDAAGRFWAGTMAIDEQHDNEGKGNLYVMETDLSAKKKLDGVTISNGMAWNADNTIMYYINTPTNYVFAFDFDVEKGEISNQRVALDLTHENGYADGMTIDDEGMLWICFYGGWCVKRYSSETGELLKQIELPVENVSCCTFGGAELNNLYITTVSKDMSEELLAKQPLAGSLFVVKNCGYKGFLPNKFKG